jgi:hypothetical protein
MEAQDAPKIGAPRGFDHDDEDLRNFIQDCLEVARDHVNYNAETEHILKETRDATEVLGEENIRSIDIRAPRFGNPRCSIYLHYADPHAKDEWQEDVTTVGTGIFRRAVPVTFSIKEW